MRKFVLFAVAVVLALGFVAAPARAQEAKTIAAIVVDSTKASPAQFTVLLAAVQAADPAILAALDNKDARLTVFAPTDEAFAALLTSLNTTAEALLGNKDLLNRVLMYHVVPAVLDAKYFVDAAAKLSADSPAVLGTMADEAGLMVAVKDGKVMVNNATVVTADVMAANGVVHVIDQVLVPAASEDMGMMATPEAGAPAPVNIAETVIAATQGSPAQFTTLLAAVQAADPSVLATLTGSGPYTVFAPTDEAFAALLKALDTTAEALLANKDLLNTVLAYHVAPGYFSAETVAPLATADKGFQLLTLIPQAITFSAMDGKIMLNGSINLVATDVMASNGIIHVIDGVLVPAE